ncbi:DUF421 domain-containing protein [Solitalea canadensis]|uniref:Putative membrane protein n=1 Tax=Solitalea canadensis (strain ATCC 29591 / DSM 3403 / JCM 21819 / LMG 8368 / NBRC 15130 / NCIMB 12057 / USAM 9D) TaxID=929556 RepID=H8KQK7_SOLCM|nr:YetF domain-containing protein [Solitalea canadensis]AFD06745.1 putative membrane protein [Solitalea canadensis DSM 3403]
MDTILKLFGEGENLSALQMSVRACFTFFISLLLVRLGGVRMFGKKSSLDIIVFIMLGAILSRGIVGASPYLPTVCAATSIVLLHRILGFISVKNRRFQNLISGKKVILYDNGELQWDNLKKTSISKSDILKSLRLETHQDSLEKISTAFLENNGRISFIIKDVDTEY